MGRLYKFRKDYTKLFTVEPAIQSAGSEGDVFQAPQPVDDFNDGLNDLPPLDLDVV